MCAQPRLPDPRSGPGPGSGLHQAKNRPPKTDDPPPQDLGLATPPTRRQSSDRWKRWFVAPIRHRGQIHVNGGARIGSHFIGLMHHEMTHAVLDNRGKGRNVPTWLNEGLAEWFDYKAQGDTDLSSSNKMQLKNTERLRKLPQYLSR